MTLAKPFTVFLSPVSKSAKIRIRILPPFSSTEVLWDNILILMKGGPQGENVAVMLCPGQILTPGAENEMKVTQLCLTLCHPMGYAVYGILQARILDWVAFPSPGDLPNPGIKPRSPGITGRFFTN